MDEIKTFGVLFVGKQGAALATMYFASREFAEAAAKAFNSETAGNRALIFEGTV